jgi:D-hydroxyproline dehydrogenase subunit beta
MTAGMRQQRFDLAVVGAGILGLATALAGARRGFKVVVIDRDARANGASVRNFGYVTVSGQERGGMWQRARRSREVWREVADAAGIAILQTGVWMTARRPESVRVLEAFMATEMAGGCRLLDPAEARRRCPQLCAPQLAAVLESSTELRVESREAIPRLASWLADAHGVTFQRETTVRGIELPHVHTSRGRLQADYVAVCPGDDFNGLYPERLGSYALTRCKLQMLRLADPGFRLPGAFMSDLGLCRYHGFSQLPPARALEARLIDEQPRHFEHGVHLIVVQSADGSLVVGDSHHYAATPDPFSQQSVDALILAEFSAALGFAPPPTLERWTGTYASASDRPVVIDAPEARVRIATVTCGAGASIGFAIGEELINSLLNSREAA